MDLRPPSGRSTRAQEPDPDAYHRRNRAQSNTRREILQADILTEYRRSPDRYRGAIPPLPAQFRELQLFSPSALSAPLSHQQAPCPRQYEEQTQSYHTPGDANLALHDSPSNHQLQPHLGNLKSCQNCQSLKSADFVQTAEAAQESFSSSINSSFTRQYYSASRTTGAGTSNDTTDYSTSAPAPSRFWTPNDRGLSGPHTQFPARSTVQDYDLDDPRSSALEDLVSQSRCLSSFTVGDHLASDADEVYEQTFQPVGVATQISSKLPQQALDPFISPPTSDPSLLSRDTRFNRKLQIVAKPTPEFFQTPDLVNSPRSYRSGTNVAILKARFEQSSEPIFPPVGNVNHKVSLSADKAQSQSHSDQFKCEVHTTSLRPQIPPEQQFKPLKDGTGVAGPARKHNILEPPIRPSGNSRPRNTKEEIHTQAAQSKWPISPRHEHRAEFAREYSGDDELQPSFASQSENHFQTSISQLVSPLRNGSSSFRGVDHSPDQSSSYESYNRRPSPPLKRKYTRFSAQRADPPVPKVKNQVAVADNTNFAGKSPSAGARLTESFKELGTRNILRNDLPPPPTRPPPGPPISRRLVSRIRFVLPDPALHLDTQSTPQEDFTESPIARVLSFEALVEALEAVCPSTDKDLDFLLSHRPADDRIRLRNFQRAFLPNRRCLDGTDMDLLQVRSPDQGDQSTTKLRAVEDARRMQASVIEEAKRAGQSPPKYILMELIGKGSYGRVYKGKDIASAKIVAVKIIDIDESDTLNPRLADTYSEFMKEVQALKLLSEVKARNINHVIEALPVGKSMWMVIEYCGGGSIATLLKPTPSGLKERFIIPILREVAEAVKWCHQAGIIHRDLKCANVLITEEGGIQLCDFGVAGITDNPRDRRNTLIGTPHWMAPEIFLGNGYGKEVDIWAFGSMAFEMATGLPPNARSGFGLIDPSQNPREIASHLEKNLPRLEASRKYSDGLQDLVRVCMQYKPSTRPTIKEIQDHSYIKGTEDTYPASSLSDLVVAFKFWESAGGDRVSLFFNGGARGPSDQDESEALNDDWNFSTTSSFDAEFENENRLDDLYQDVYGKSGLPEFSTDETSRPVPRSTRRRPPPEALAPLKQPLERLFDPNTISNYEDNSRSHYGMGVKPTSDLPLRDDTAQTSIRDTMIDLGGHDAVTGLSSFADVETIKPRRRDESEDDEFEIANGLDFSRPALSDPADNPNRRTQDWTFPSISNPPATANPELNGFYQPYELQRPSVTPGSGSRPTLVHHPTEPIGLPSITSNLILTAPGSPSRSSMIDLDLCIPEPSRPSTADSTTSQEVTSANPFHLENHASMYENSLFTQSMPREPSLYLPDTTNMGFKDLSSYNDMSDLSDVEDPISMNSNSSLRNEGQSFEAQDYEEFPQTFKMPARSGASHSGDRQNLQYTVDHIPTLAPPPSARAMSGTADDEEMIGEMARLLGAMNQQLENFKDVYVNLPTGERRERRDRTSNTIKR